MFANRFIRTKNAKNRKMPESIDVRDLSGDDVEIIKALVEKLRGKTCVTKKTKKFAFQWEGGLRHIAEKASSVELQHKSLNWR